MRELFMLLWWAVRLWLQFFGFDLREIEGSVANRLAKHLLTLLFRMLGICCVLPGCLKGLVYAEWAGAHRLKVGQYLVFSSGVSE